jgi:glycosyltransferase involved in cell wall biosynthesis
MQMSPDRAAQGWQVPGLGAARLQHAPSADAAAKLVGEAPENSIHICQGLRGNGGVGDAQRSLAARGLRQWVVMETVDDDEWRGALKRLAYRRLILLWRDRLQGILATGHATPGWLTARGMPAARVFPFAYFLPCEFPVLEFCRHARFRFLFAGHLVERKRLGLLIDALARLDSSTIELVVIGSGPLERDLRARAKAHLGPSVTWLGLRPQSEMPIHMAGADCLVLPSRHDGWGAVVSEALMVGTPAICSDRCGAADVVKESGYGGVFSNGDINALTLMLRKAIGRGRQTPEERRSLALWARCLGSEAGARYLAAILQHVDAGGEKPIPPWRN